MLVIDASAAVQASLPSSGFDRLAGRELVAPSLLWSEAASALHELQWRREISPALAGAALRRLLDATIRRQSPDIRDVWQVANELGWAKTYDAEYVALARALGCALLTIDERLQRGAARVVATVVPADL